MNQYYKRGAIFTLTGFDTIVVRFGLLVIGEVLTLRMKEKEEMAEGDEYINKYSVKNKLRA